MASKHPRRCGDFFSIGLLAALFAGLSSCASPRMNVELRHLHPVLVSSKETEGRTLLHLEGWVMVSRGGIEKISLAHGKEELRLNIELGLNDGLSPEIDFQTLIPASVDRVVLGRERVLIWDRAHGPLVKPRRVKTSHLLPFGFGPEVQIQAFNWDAWNRRVDKAQ